MQYHRHFGPANTGPRHGENYFFVVRVLQQLGGQSHHDSAWWYLEIYGCRVTNKLYSKRFRRGGHGLTGRVAYLEGFGRFPQPLS